MVQVDRRQSHNDDETNNNNVQIRSITSSERRQQPPTPRRHPPEQNSDSVDGTGSSSSSSRRGSQRSASSSTNNQGQSQNSRARHQQQQQHLSRNTSRTMSKELTKMTIDIPNSSEARNDVVVDLVYNDRYSLDGNGRMLALSSPEDMSHVGAAEQWLTSPLTRLNKEQQKQQQTGAAYDTTATTTTARTTLPRFDYEHYPSPINECFDARSSISNPSADGRRGGGGDFIMSRDTLLWKKEIRQRIMQHHMGSWPITTTDTTTTTNTNKAVEQETTYPIAEFEEHPQHKAQHHRSRSVSINRKSSLRIQRPPPLLRLSDCVEHNRSHDIDDHDHEEHSQSGNTAAAVKHKTRSPKTIYTSSHHPPPRSPQTRTQPKHSSRSGGGGGDGDDDDDDQHDDKNTNNTQHAVLLRLSRQLRMGRRGELPSQQRSKRRKSNRITLHVYDLMSRDTIMILPFGCDFPIGKCFHVLNSGLHTLGTGAYHVGIEVNGIEYAFGANNITGCSGVFTCIPKCSPGYQYRTSIDFGERELTRKRWVSIPKVEKDSDGVKNIVHGNNYREVLTFVDGRSLVKEMASEYMGKDYDLLRKNCCTFAIDVCQRLGVDEEEIPSWFRNLAHAGRITKDVALSTFEPLQLMLSSCENCNAEDIVLSEGDEFIGFEVIAQVKHKNNEARTAMEIVQVVEADPITNSFKNHHDMNDGSTSPIGVRRTLSWTY